MSRRVQYGYVSTDDIGAVRVSAAEQDQAAREQRAADALRYLRRHGHDDIAVILGLIPEMCEAGCGAPAVRRGRCRKRACRPVAAPSGDTVGAREAARLLGVSAETVRAWIVAGRLQATRDDRGMWRIPAAEVAALVDQPGGAR